MGSYMGRVLYRVLTGFVGRYTGTSERSLLRLAAFLALGLKSDFPLRTRFEGQKQAKDLVPTVGDFEAMLASWIFLGLAVPAAAQVNRSSHFLSRHAVDGSSRGLRCGGLDLPETLGSFTIPS